MSALDVCQPFALLWDNQSQAARLFTQADKILRHDNIQDCLSDLRAHRQGWLAGGLGYEIGHQLETRLNGCSKTPPFAWFGTFRSCQMLDLATMQALLATWKTPTHIGEINPLINASDWMQAVRDVKSYIQAGDIYQANLTFPAYVKTQGHPTSIFAKLFSPQTAPYGGIVHLGDGQWWISLSPELFFKQQNGKLTARPMKGTAPRANNIQADQDMANELAADPKNRAENLMITDLLRNDLSRVAKAGTVRTTALFQIETYPTVHQMTSTIEAELAPDMNTADILEALFPCGSITGAPKIRAMQIISELEPFGRGIYCGSIGWIGPDGQDSQFNVAIRTLDWANNQAKLGLGAGIVADSDPASEWQECLTKSRFLHASRPNTLLETMRLQSDGSIPRLAYHLARLEASAHRFGFNFNKSALQSRLQHLKPTTDKRLRVLLSATGNVTLQVADLPPAPNQPVDVRLADIPFPATDWRWAHKSTDRAALDKARQQSQAYECIFKRPDSLLTEGSFTNLFVPDGDILLTPPLELGLLPGTLRAELLDQGKAKESLLRAEDLANGFFIGNSLRGLIPARLVSNS